MKSVVGALVGKSYILIIDDVCAPSASVDNCSVAVNFLYVC